MLTATDGIGKGLTVWIWTGDVGDKFDEMGDYLEISVDQGQPKKATGAIIRPRSPKQDLGLKGNGDARYGRR